MLFTKRISRVLANELATKYCGAMQKCAVIFGAFTTCHYKVKFSYKKMRVEAYPFFPCSQLWIQNFVLNQNINFSIGKALPTIGLETPFKDFFSNKNIQIFSHHVYDIDATKLFCQKIENEGDIVGLQLGEGEYLCISDGQIVLQSKSKKIDSLAKRIDVLSNLFERYAKT
jgi:hypothetical protein